MQPELARHKDRNLLKTEATAFRRLRLSSTLVKFMIVGGIAYLINQSVLFLLYDTSLFWFMPAKDTAAGFLLFTHPDIRLLLASILAVEVAIIFQFNAHERWTFRDRVRQGRGLVRFLKFNLTSVGSPIIIVVTVNTLTPMFGISPYISNTIGVLGGVTLNWTMNTLVIWPRQQRR